TQKRLQSITIDYYRYGFLPTLSGFYNYNRIYQNNNFSELYHTAYPNQQAGAQFALPLFTGLRRIQNLKIARLQDERLDLDLFDTKNQITTEYDQAIGVYKGALSQLNALQDNLVDAKEVYRVINLQYREGIKTFLELTVAEADLRTAQLNYYNAEKFQPNYHGPRGTGLASSGAAGRLRQKRRSQASWPAARHARSRVQGAGRRRGERRHLPRHRSAPQRGAATGRAEQDAIALQQVDVSKADVANAQSQIAAAQAALRSVELDVRHSVITAPLTGTIGIAQVKLGALVSQGQTLINTVSAEDPIAVDVNIGEQDIARFTKLQQAKGVRQDSIFTLQVPGGQTYKLPGKIVTIDRAVDPQTGTLKVRVQFANPRHLLKAGMNVTLRAGYGHRRLHCAGAPGGVGPAELAHQPVPRYLA
nr:hypothetical protein [Tanacetum cinerariifolium]